MIPTITNSRAVERQQIEEALRAVEVTETITYAALSEVTGSPIRSIWHCVARAREILAPEGYVFEAVDNVGLRRMTEQEISVVIPSARRRRIHQQAKRATLELAAISSVENLTAFERSSALIGRSLFGAILAVTTQKAMVAISQQVERTGNTLPVGDTIAAFRQLG